MYVCMYVCITFLLKCELEGSDLGLNGAITRNLPKVTRNIRKISLKTSSRWADVSTRKMAEIEWRILSAALRRLTPCSGTSHNIRP
jgi:hypothetical protein